MLLALAAGLALPPVRAHADVGPAPAAAPHEPQTRKFQHSRYERETIAGALERLGLTLDAAPEGKTVAAIDTVRLEVIEERDPAPRFLNVFHVVTRDRVVLREVLLRPGEPYRASLADETQRNLSTLPQFSLVLVVAARGSAPDRVHVVVITKDVWSIRLNWDIALTTTGVEGLSINPAETNLLGTHQTLGLLFKWLPASHSFGAEYVEPRLMGKHVTVATDAGIVLNNATGAAEGSFADLLVTAPLWSTRTEWAWGAGLSWSREVARLYTHGEVAAFALDPATSCSATPALCVPWAYRATSAAATAFVTRSFGWAVKQDVSLGLEARRSVYEGPDPTGYDPATVQAFQATRVPRDDQRVGPYVQYRTYTTDFLRVLDLDTLALQEDYRLGPQAHVRLYPLPAALGSRGTRLGAAAGAGWTVAIGDGLVSAAVDSTTELRAPEGDVSDGSVRGELRLASPRFPAGRIVADAVVLDRYANALNRLSYLGGDSRLRGYPSEAFVGQHLFAANVELRSRPWQLLDSLQLGGVLFYDAGDAFDAWSALRLRQAVGAGARVLFPQLDRVVFRMDVGFPLTRPLPAGAGPVTFFATFGQVF